MKRKVSYFLLFLLPAVFFFKKFQGKEEQPDYVKISSEIMAEYINDINMTYGVSCYGSGGSFLDNVKMISLSFSASNMNLSIDQSRIMIVNAVESLLKRVNDDERIHPYLEHFPFSSRGIKISFSFHNNKGERVSEEFVAYASTDEKGRVFYSGYDHKAEKFKDLHQETYEEALRIVREQGRLAS
ncbi:hypothetical protein [Simkania sp.]|uniref:hypothetical protein n=1 Tax=Simkania sp. TaxID=34094 RepID=UPI003B51908A